MQLKAQIGAADLVRKKALYNRLLTVTSTAVLPTLTLLVALLMAFRYHH